MVFGGGGLAWERGRRACMCLCGSRGLIKDHKLTSSCRAVKKWQREKVGGEKQEV